MTELTDLYQELILDHNRSPRNRRRPVVPSRQAEGYNPLCGDRVTVYVSLDGEVLKDVSFEGSGCAISTAAASIMTQGLKGKSVGEARALFEKFRRLVTGDPTGDGEPELGKLHAFGGVSRFPARVKCATLVWHTLMAALNDRGEVVSTE